MEWCGTFEQTCSTFEGQYQEQNWGPLKLFDRPQCNAEKKVCIWFVNTLKTKNSAGKWELAGKSVTHKRDGKTNKSDLWDIRSTITDTNKKYIRCDYKL